MRVYLDSRDWRVGYYRGTDHHYFCPLPCLVIRISRRTTPGRQACETGRLRAAAVMTPITIEELVADAHRAVAETDWADEGAGLSTESYLASLQASLLASHQLKISELNGLGRPAFAVAGPGSSSTWTVCVPGIGPAPCSDLTDASAVADDLLHHHAHAVSTAPLRLRQHDHHATEPGTTP